MSGPDVQFVEWTKRRVGTTVKEKYRVDDLIGIGGMATIYAATHRNGRRVALKILHPELTEREDIRQRFRRECQAANLVHHPGAVAIIDDDVDDDGSAFLVMELLEGKSLEELWQRNGKRLPPQLVLSVAREVCEVLAAAHKAGIVHRDIKPENIFLTKDAKVKLLDFGLARLKDATGRRGDTHTGMVFGTPAFMPPEQASGRTSEIDERTDLWALGASMFTLLSGEPVHEGESIDYITRNAALIPVRPLVEVMPDAPPVLAGLVDRALIWEKEQRWPNATAMRDAIRDACKTLFGDELPELIGADELTGVPPKPKSEGDEAVPTAPSVVPVATAPSVLPRAEEPEDTRDDNEETLSRTLHDHDDDDNAETNVRSSNREEPAAAPVEATPEVPAEDSQEETSVMDRGASKATAPETPSSHPPPAAATDRAIERPNVVLPWVLAGIATLVALVAVWFAVAKGR